MAKTGMQFLLYGYTGYIQIGKNTGGNLITSLLTSYSLTRNLNPIKSNANTRLKPSNSWKFDRLVNDVAFDYPTHELSISLQLNKPMLDFLIEQLKDDYFHTPLQINFIDDNAQLSYNFTNVFITGFSFNVSNNAIATASLSGTIFEKDFVMEIKSQSMQAEKYISELNNLVGATLLPYWNWQFIFKNLFKGIDVMDFSVSFSRQITPKFTCQSSYYALPPAKIISSIPTITYECNYIMFRSSDEEGSSSFEYYNDLLNSDQIIKINNNDDNEKLSVDIQFDGNLILTLNDCYIDNITPSVGNSGSVNSFNINGTVYGSVV